MSVITESDTKLSRQECQKALTGYVGAIQKARSNTREMSEKAFGPNTAVYASMTVDKQAALFDPALFSKDTEILLTKMAEAIDNPTLDATTVMNFSWLVGKLAGFNEDDPFENPHVSVGLSITLVLIDREYDFTEDPMAALRDKCAG